MSLPGVADLFFSAVKLTDPKTKIQCDININDQFGVRNSRLLKAYLDLTPVARPLAVCIKQWAKKRGLVRSCVPSHDPHGLTYSPRTIHPGQWDRPLSHLTPSYYCCLATFSPSITFRTFRTRS
jgi:hypothetical protein